MSDTIVTITGKNNALNRVNDQYCGGDGGGVAAHPGQLLKTKRLTKAQALQLSDTAIGTLYAGIYQYVQTLSTQSQAVVKGHACFWKTAANYEAGIVSSDGGATVEGRFAGVFINVITAGYFGWIQVEGEATCQLRATIGDNTDGNVCRVTTTTFTFDAVADGTASATYGTLKGVVGVMLEAGADAGLKKVLLKGNGRNF